MFSLNPFLYFKKNNFIGQLCTCDVDNFGDILYPVIFQKMAEQQGITSRIVPLSFFRGASPREADFTISGINEAIKSPTTSLSHLVIGGGDILRTDVKTVASHYYSNIEKSARKRFWFWKKKPVFDRRRQEEKFVQKYMGYSPIAPFILNRANHANVGSIVYCSCGVPFRFPPEKFHIIREAFEAAAFVYVRDGQSRKKLEEAGVRRDIEVAPDLIVTLSDFFDRDEERAKGLALLARCGADTTKDIVCFQSSPQPPEQADESLQQLTRLKEKTGVEIVILPLGFCHGDDIFLRQLAQRSGGSLVYVDAHSIRDVISVIAACELFIGTSMHGNITAFSFGIPHLFGPIAVDKAEGFLEVVGLGADFKLKSWSQLVAKQAMVACLPQDYFLTRAAAAKRAVHATFGKMAGILKTSVLKSGR